MLESLWGEDFSIKDIPKQTKTLIKKIKEPLKDVIKCTERVIKSNKVSLDEKLRLIQLDVERILGFHKDDTLIIRDIDTLHLYIDKAIENMEIAVDTETNNSLDPITCKLMGPCIYTPGMKNAYIPINHIDKQTKERLDWQLTEEDIKEEFSRLNENNVKIIMHNGKFDYEVLKCTTDLCLSIYWDTMIAAKVLDENEKSAGLKQQYIDKLDPSIEKYSIEHLFKNIEYSLVDPEIFALYAATDAFMTYKLYKWQKEQFEKPENKKIYDLFMNIEMPVIEVVAGMELNGIELDLNYASLLSKKYHDILDTIDKEIEIELAGYRDKIEEWSKTEDALTKPPKKTGEGFGKSKVEQLESPINIASPTQLAILLYDILKVGIIDKESPRGTGEAILQKIDLNITQLLLKRRGVVKLLTAFIDALPKTINVDGRVHCHFNQYGAATGRFSSSDPNLQQIPSHNKEIRMMFKARDNYVLVGSDFSQQEPRLLSQYSQDENMINAYKEGKDLYATIATGVYNNTYWDNMEVTQDGKPNPEGKKRRGSVKSLLLGIMYGRGVASIAEQIHGTVEEAQKIIDDFYRSFPKVKNWMDDTINNAHKLGYVEDLWGRRRRLPDLLLPKYSIKTKDNLDSFNPLLESKGIITPQSLKNIKQYEDKLNKCKNKREFELISQQALKEGITITSNTGFIAQAERQCVNARIQGGAASMTKLAMIKLHKDKALNDLGFKLLIGVHDELIGECPKENAQAVADRLCYVMKTAASGIVEVPFKCDPDIAECWYLNDYQDLVRKEFKELILQKSIQEAFNEVCNSRPESTREQMRETLAEFIDSTII